MEQSSQISASTSYRYHEVNRAEELPIFLQFKHQNKVHPSQTQSSASKISEEQIQKLKRVYPHGISGRSTSNDIVVVDCVGNIKMNEILKIMDEDSFEIYSLSRLISLSE